MGMEAYMSQKQEIIDIKKANLHSKTHDMKNAGYRLAQILALKDLTLLYCFVKDETLVALRYSAKGSDPVESISDVYPYAFMYENEIKDLFGINVANMNLDFNGHFYETATKMPFRAPVPAEGMVKDSE